MERTRRTRDFCADWLLQVLAENGPMKVSDIVEAAKEQGYSRAMVFRVREMLQDVVVNTLGYRHPDNCWRREVTDGN